MTEDEPHRVVVIGGGFGGLQAVHGLRGANVEVTVIDRRNATATANCDSERSISELVPNTRLDTQAETLARRAVRVPDALVAAAGR